MYIAIIAKLILKCFHIIDININNASKRATVLDTVMRDSYNVIGQFWVDACLILLIL